MNGSLAFTWSPNPKQFTGIKPEYQYYDTLPLIQNMNKCCYYQIYPELTTQGNIHYHGIIDVFDKIKWYKSVLPKFKYHGFVLLKSNINEEWKKYCEKDMSNMQKILNIKIPIVFDKTSSTRKLKYSVPESIASLDVIN